MRPSLISLKIADYSRRLLRLLTLTLPGLVLLAGCAAQPSFYHTVEPGQTLYRIGQAYQVDARHLARINGIDDPTSLRVGQRVFIPGATQAVVVPKNLVNPEPPSQRAAGKKPPGQELSPSSKPALTSPANPQTPHTPLPKTETPAPATGQPTAPQVPEKGRFQWPLKGPVVRNFGSTGGTLSKGIEIYSPVGSAVHSAGAGRVIYSSDGVAGYGNLIIIRHGDGFFSVYGFNKKNLVPVGTFVSRGQRIALSGYPPGGGSPRLHFEIRNGKEAVNPIFYLP